MCSQVALFPSMETKILRVMLLPASAGSVVVVVADHVLLAPPVLMMNAERGICILNSFCCYNGFQWRDMG